MIRPFFVSFVGLSIMLAGQCSRPSTAIRPATGATAGGAGVRPRRAPRSRIGLLQHGSRRLQLTYGRGPIDQRRHRHALEPVRLSIAPDGEQQLPAASLLAERQQHQPGPRRDSRSACAITPRTRDITDGDALNVLLDILTNPANGGSSIRRIKTPLKAELIQEIPFEYRFGRHHDLPGSDDDERPVAAGPAR